MEIMEIYKYIIIMKKKTCAEKLKWVTAHLYCKKNNVLQLKGLEGLVYCNTMLKGEVYCNRNCIVGLAGQVVNCITIQHCIVRQWAGRRLCHDTITVS